MKVEITKEAKGNGLILWPEGATERLLADMIRRTFERIGCLTDICGKKERREQGVRIYLANIQILNDDEKET